ncbi:MauE/DoxX family redox-associated membrane protein [Niastella yeongjuensis]|uniref:MauE/DoxX family redox-associated membrane protein n=1 Tax=Niastella yeongjuensis TaxID=354355 RepID=UPI0008D809C2|nr:MauE/DoxX family redox-associated membrane protein [Niastella yeongjuensis]SEO56064.1 Methylamine utilisation protein MauE [Niastella yeongjuensis]
MKKDLLSSSYLTREVFLQKRLVTSWLNKSLIIELICSLLIILFIYSSLSKLSAYDRFSVQLSKSPFITSYYQLVAWSIPTIEIVIAVLLAFKRTRLVALYASFFLMSLFTAYLVIMLNFSYYIPCSCGGVLEYMSWEQHIVFNAFFIVIAGAGVLLKANTTKSKNIYA